MCTFVGPEVCMMHAFYQIKRGIKRGVWNTSVIYIRTLSGVPVPIVILGDPAYLLLPWLIKPYLGVGVSEKWKKFNRKLNRARVVVECAFGRLKGGHC